MYKKKKGFTLVEIVIVVTILGVLSSISLVRYDKVQKNAKESSDYIAASSLATAVSLAINDGIVNTTESEVEVQDLIDSGYLISAPKSQTTQQPFEIEIEEKSKGSAIVIKCGDKQFYPRVE